MSKRGLISLKVLAEHKYELVRPVFEHTGITSRFPCNANKIKFGRDGFLEVQPGYIWDGASGPAIDTANSHRASLVHDALYQLIREGYIRRADRIKADKFFRGMLIDAGMSRFRAWYWYFAVRIGGRNHTR